MTWSFKAACDQREEIGLKIQSMVIYHLTFLICHLLQRENNLNPPEAQLRVPIDSKALLNGQMKNVK
jgi:hypothetical protein